MVPLRWSLVPSAAIAAVLVAAIMIVIATLAVVTHAIPWGVHPITSGSPSAYPHPAQCGRSRTPAAGYHWVATLDPGAPGSMTNVAWAPDSSVVATSDKDGTTYLWNPATCQLTGSFSAPGGAGLAFTTAISPSGSLLATGYSNGRTYLWDIASERLIATLRDPGPRNAARQVESVAFSPDGRTLVSVDGNGYVAVWRVGSAHPTLARSMRDPAGPGIGVWSAAFSSGGTLATGDYQGNIYLWDVSSGTSSGPLVVPGGIDVTALAFSPDGSVLAAGSGSGSKGGVYLINVSTQAVHDVTNPGPVWALSFDGSTLAAADYDGKTHLFDVHEGSLTATATQTLADPNSGSQGVGAMGFSPDGKWLVTGDTNGRAYVWSSAPPPPNTAQSEANSINSVLTYMANSRSQLGTPSQEVTGCSDLSSAVSQIQGIASSRSSQLASAQNLPVGLLPNGGLLKSQLLAALRVSLRADRDYIAWGQDEESGGCGSGYGPAQDLNSVNPQATAAKDALSSTWDSIASQYGLPQYFSNQI